MARGYVRRTIRRDWRTEQNGNGSGKGNFSLPSSDCFLFLFRLFGLVVFFFLFFCRLPFPRARFYYVFHIIFISSLVFRIFIYSFLFLFRNETTHNAKRMKRDDGGGNVSEETRMNEWERERKHGTACHCVSSWLHNRENIVLSFVLDWVICFTHIQRIQAHTNTHTWA